MRRSAVICLVSTLAACGGEDRAAAARAEGSPGAATADSAGAGGADVRGGAPDGARGSTPIAITAVVNGAELTASGLAECEHAAQGSIYERPAALWTARYAGEEGRGIRQLNLTFWREASGAESVTMSLEVGDAVHRIATVPGGSREGSGTARLEGDASAGTLVVEGTSAEGASVQVRARCERFTTLVAEGG